MKQNLLGLAVLGSTLAFGALTGCAAETDGEDDGTTEAAATAARPDIALPNEASNASIQAKLFTMLKLSGRANLPGVDAAFKLDGKISVGRRNVKQSIECHESALRGSSVGSLLRACTLKGFAADGTTGRTMQSDSFPATLFKIMEDLSTAEDIASMHLGITSASHTEATEVSETTLTLKGTGGELKCSAGTVGLTAVQQYECSFKKAAAPAIETKTGKLKNVISIGGELGPQLVGARETVELELDALPPGSSSFVDGAEALVKGSMGTTMGVEIRGLRPVFKATAMFVCPTRATTMNCMPPVTGDGGFCAPDVRSWAESKCSRISYVD